MPDPDVEKYYKHGGTKSVLPATTVSTGIISYFNENFEINFLI